MENSFEHNGYKYSILYDDVVQLTYLGTPSEIYIPKYAMYKDKRYEVRDIAPTPKEESYYINIEEDGRRKPKYVSKRSWIIVNISANRIKESFNNCNKSTVKIHFHDNIHTIGDYAFYNFCKIKNLELPTKLKVIGDYAFYGCKELEALYLPNGLSSIGSHAFAECTHMKSILIPEAVTSIGTGAFYNCYGLEKVIIGPGIKNIGEYAFNIDNRISSYSSLKYVDIYADPFEVIIAPNAFRPEVKVSYYNPTKYIQKNIAPSLKAELALLISSLNSFFECRTNIVENQPTNCNNNRYEIDLDKLIDAVVADGVITEKERAVILKKATAAGYDADEVEILLDARLYEKQAEHKPIKKTSVEA